MSFENGVRIVWNLTNACPYNCPMCVASANKRIEENVDKLAILNSILSVNNDIISIDFSGGDPLFNKSDIEIIKEALGKIGKNKISISATGLSISKLSDEEILELAQEYDLTYDFPRKYKDFDIRDKEYNECNYNQAMRIKKLGIDVNIFVPIRNIEDVYYKELASDIVELNPKLVKLLRLMPMGNNLKINKSESIDKCKYLIEQLRNLGYNGKIEISCAMKHEFNEMGNCNMLSERKLGLDQQGNLFTCIWAADILEDRATNPFYLGNLLEKKLLDILSSNSIKRYKSRLENDRNKCHVLEYFNTDNKEVKDY